MSYADDRITCTNCGRSLSERTHEAIGCPFCDNQAGEGDE